MRRTRGRGRANLDTAVVDLWGRELGELPTKTFANRFAASQDLVLRLDVYRKLERHRGSVNTVSFSGDGNLLVSGSDDRRVIIWDWQSGDIKLSFHSGHTNNVFQAMIMPYTDDRSIVTCAADGQVRLAQILECGQVETKLLGRHGDQAHKLAIEPASPYIFYSCGEDGLVHHFDLRTPVGTPSMTCQCLSSQGLVPYIRLYTIAIDPRNPNLFAVGGSNVCAQLYDIRKSSSSGSIYFGEPVDHFGAPHLIGKIRQNLVSITDLAFSDQSELLVSYGKDFIYLFTKEMGQGSYIPEACEAIKGSEIEKDEKTTESLCETNVDHEDKPRVYKGHKNCKTVKGVNFFGPKCEYVVSGSDCGRIFVWEKKTGKLIRVMEADKHVVNCIESHPDSTVLASSGIENTIKIWTPKALEKASLPTDVDKVLIAPPVQLFPLMDNTSENTNVEDCYRDFPLMDSTSENTSEEDRYWDGSFTDNDDDGDDIFIGLLDLEDDDYDGTEDSFDGFSSYDIHENNNGSSDGEDY